MEVVVVTTSAAASAIERHRQPKAERLADYLRAQGVSPRAAAHMDEQAVRAVEAALGYKPGTGAAFRRAVAMLAGSARVTARCPTCRIGDPRGPVGPPRPFGHAGVCTR